MVANTESGASGSERTASLAAFGERVRDLRRQAGLTQQALADRAGLDRVAINRIEHGTREIGVGRVPLLAVALGVAPGDLFQSSDDQSTGGDRSVG